MTADRGGYNRTCELTFRVLQLVTTEWPGPKPLFKLPPKGVALIASIGDIGHRLAANPEAHAVVDFLCAESQRQGLADVPTVMMLAVVLEQLGLPVERVPLRELGLNVGTT